MNFEYLAQPPKRFTFEQPKLKLWCEKWCKGKTLNLFAGTTIMKCDEFRVDINKEMIATLGMDLCCDCRRKVFKELEEEVKIMRKLRKK